MNLFDHHCQTLSQSEAPLAARLRPRTLDEFVGQAAIVGPGRLLRRAIQADQLSSLIFYGPPGTGKTTLAQIIANTTRAHFIAINAVLAGVKEIRAAVDTAQERRGMYGQRTILFVDEVHRFNKAQQDALLPWVENGTIVLIGATTENPYFEVNKALVSRSRLFQLKPLTSHDLAQIVVQALNDRDRGYGDRDVHLNPEACEHLVNVANGDARALLNALELAVETTAPDENGTITITLVVAEESIQQRAVLYDKEGDAHFDTISAFIKSLRGSDPDAALYWLARMVYSGEDPRYLFRRMLILASEDVGLADPQAVVVVNACAMAFDRVGLPEGHYPLAQATLYLANAPKSNSTMGFFDALKRVEQARSGDIPNPLKDASRDKHSFGHGANYRYPHAYQDHWVAQQYLPANLQGQVFYQPSDQGYEATIATQVIRRREAQLAAWIEQESVNPEVLTFGPRDATTDRWLQRAMGQMGERLGKIRDRLFHRAHCQRHHLVLILNAGNGLLTWEASRQVPEGGVYAYVQTDAEAKNLYEQAAALPELRRPIVVQELPDLTFDRILARNASGSERICSAMGESTFPVSITQRLAPDGRLILVENLPQHTQRLYRWLDRAGLETHFYQQLAEAEEALYQEDPLLNWTEADLKHVLESTGLRVDLEVEPTSTSLQITPGLLQRWFSDEPTSYAGRLGQHLSQPEIEEIYQVFRHKLGNQVVQQQGAIVWITAKRHGIHGTLPSIPQ